MGRRVIIIPNYLKAESVAFSHTASEIFEKNGYEVIILSESDTPNEEVELALVLGGDGTILRACKKLYLKDIPMFGINFGNMGYLTECNPETALEGINKLIKGEYNIQNRLMLEGEVVRNGQRVYDFSALNEASLFRSTLKKAFRTEVYINGMHIQTVLGDGVIVATPTGSTSYNLSAGGPVLTPESNSMVITPVSPMHFLHSSVVTGGEDEITLEVKINSLVQGACVTLDVDGDSSFDIYDGDVVKIKKASKYAKIIKVNDTSFYEILRQKLSKANS
ncbi:MAG: NAD(+)/NADH kinase [Clostridia bacterium]|nr:NAD(+)/NADH kinase [Clostridia bacterium]